VDNVLLTAGVACLIGALVRGGLKAFGVELPLIQSRLRQAALAGLGFVFIVLAGARLPALPGQSPSVPTQVAAATHQSASESTALPAAASTAPVPTLGPRGLSAPRVTLSGSVISVRTLGPGQ
jgi:hypothetical protein